MSSVGCVICAKQDITSRGVGSGDGLTCVWCYYQLWRPNLIKKWEEDDAHPPDAERFGDAWQRLTGRGWCAETARVQHVLDTGYTFFFAEGWVAVRDCDGSTIYRHSAWDDGDIC